MKLSPSMLKTPFTNKLHTLAAPKRGQTTLFPLPSLSDGVKYLFDFNSFALCRLALLQTGFRGGLCSKPVRLPARVVFQAPQASGEGCVLSPTGFWGGLCSKPDRSTRSRRLLHKMATSNRTVAKLK